MSTVISPADFRNAMACWAMTVHVVTTSGSAGYYGFTASALCPVTDDPATLVLCLNHMRGRDVIFRENGVLRINTLAQEQKHIADIFAGRAGQPASDRFRQGGVWEVDAAYGPALENAVTQLACSIDDARRVGTHTILTCAVRTVHINGHLAPLVHARRAYAALA